MKTQKITYTLRRPDGLEFKLDETKRRFVQTMFKAEWCRVQVAKKDGAYPDEESFQQALRQVYYKCGMTPPKPK